MKVSNTQPFQIIYSIYEHQYLGHLFESFVVQKNGNGELTLRHQNISRKNADDFASGLDDTDYKLLELIDDIQQKVVVKKFYNKKITPADFFLKVYDKQKGDKVLQDVIFNYLDTKKSEILANLKYKEVYIMGDDGEPISKKINIPEKKASVLFHFVRNEDNTHYFPTIKHDGQKIFFQYKGAILLSNKPAWLIVDDQMYNFEKDVEGKKLKPFLNKKFIIIPKKVEENYYKNFVAGLVAQYNVYAQGFEINTESHKGIPLLNISELAQATSSISMFDKAEKKEAKEELNTKIVFELSFKYGEYTFGRLNSGNPVSVKMEKVDDSYVFHRIRRSEVWEKKIIKNLLDRSLELKHGKAALTKSRAFDWINTNIGELKDEGFVINQQIQGSKKYFIGKSSIEIKVIEKIDWFDIHAVVMFGDFEVSFKEIRKLISKSKNEFSLPSGEIAVIPHNWFERYEELMAFSSEGDENNLKLNKHHLAVIEELKNKNLAKVNINDKLQNLRDFEGMQDYPMPTTFKGELRPYQKAGYNWMQFLKEYNFGGCLADDMGLGKTVQTLSFLLDQKEKQEDYASLLVMPTSLIYNWEAEAKKFTPDLKILIYTGGNRDKDITKFSQYDLILTTYGVARIDVQTLSHYYFHYIILDESQAIKNPSSGTAKALNEFKSKHRLILTGTPIENSTLDLWSQMNFANPGLLGAESFFRKNYQFPIEKKANKEKTKKLHALVKPFIMRRQKSQVLTELPDKIEHIHYCKMTPEQEEVYNNTKDYFREQILDQIETEGRNKSQIALLQGLTKLRQIANHPYMAEENYTGSSGKLEDILEMYKNALQENHKILIFSQFVKHLSILKKELDAENVPYAYLDGATRDRQKQVEVFQENEGIRLFLISLKAGGVGLNLTAADYVFILDPWWNPASEAQAVDRAHRMGQKNTVFTYKFITKDTVEEKILKLQQSKKQLAGSLISIEESFVKSLSTNDIEELLT